MAYTNVLNAVWNALHEGKRVPVNDTGIAGAPTALNASLPEWADGSVNKAVYYAWIQYYGFEPINLADAEAGTMDLLRCTYHVIPEMLYGFNGDARYKRPGDMMSFRGYPTGVVLSHELITELAYSATAWGPNGALLSSGQYSILSAKVTLQYKLPYSFQYTAVFKRSSTTLFTYEVQIAAGSLIPTHYRAVGGITWLPLNSGKIFYSVDMVGYIGDQTFIGQAINVLQEPYYGTLLDGSATIQKIDYDPAIVPNIVAVGSAFFVSSILNPACYVNTCSEISNTKLFEQNSGTPTQLYTTYGSINVGAAIWKNLEGTIPANTGRYVWAEYSHTYDAGTSCIEDNVEVYRINRIITVVGGFITSSYDGFNAGSVGCLLNSSCS